MDNNELHHHTPLVTVVFVLIVVSAIIFLWYLKVFAPQTQPAISPYTAESGTQTESSSDATLNAGATVQTTEEAPIVNPIDGAYTNPF